MLELLILVALAFPVAAIVAIVMAAGTRTRIRLLELRLVDLEGRLAGLPAATVIPEPPPAPAAAAVEPERSPEPAPVAEPVAPITPESRETPEPALAARSPIIPPPAPPSAPAISFEERFGTQWVVWVGAFAVAIGGVFLVRYSIEQGLIGPGARIMLGALLAAVLIGVGEWARRTERLSGITGVASAHIPSLLTAAGTTVAYADVYAAYGLYGFIGPAGAFILLGIVALATLAAALLHGPALAGLGLVGAYVTPLLVSSDAPNYWALYLYLAVVTAAAFVLARLRLWRWLALAASVFGFMWTMPGLDVVMVHSLSPHLFHVVAGFTLAAALIVAGLLYGPDIPAGRLDTVSSASLSAYLLAAFLLVIATLHDAGALAIFVLLIAATVTIAWKTDAAMPVVPVAAVLVALVFVHWAVVTEIFHLVAPSGPAAGVVPEPTRAEFGWHLVLGALFAAMFGGAGFLAQGRSEEPRVAMLWSAAAVFAPVAILAALYYRIAGFDRSIPFATLALVLAALFAYATEALTRRAPRPGLAAASAIFATGSVAALALALTLAMEKGWLTIGLALMVPGIAWVAEKRPLPALRVLAAVIVALVIARIGWEPRIVADVGTVQIFNWLLYGYGTPAAAFWIGAYLLRRRADDAPARVVDAGAILFTVLLVTLEIRHAVYRGDIYFASASLAEIGLDVSAGLALVIGLERLRVRSHSIVHDFAALLIAAVTLLAIIFGLGFGENPLLWSHPVGGIFVNLVLLSYGIPAVLAGVLGLVTRGRRPRAYSTAVAIVAVGLAMSYLTLQVRTLFHGPVLTSGFTSNAEQYTYSAVWLAFGVALLAAGMLLRSQPVRLASAAVVVLTVVKVFLVDMSDLTGIYQALSFIVTGLVLLAIGWFYQRLLFPRRLPAPVAST